MTSKASTILVVGAAGKFAGLVVPAFAKRGARIRGLNHDSTQSEIVIQGGTMLTISEHESHCLVSCLHPFQSEDRELMVKFRAAAAPAKGHLGPDMRAVFDQMMEMTPYAPGVTYEERNIRGLIRTASDSDTRRSRRSLA